MSKLTKNQKEVLRNIQDKIKESLSGKKSYETLVSELKVLVNASENLNSYYNLLRDIFVDSSSIPDLNVEKLYNNILSLQPENKRYVINHYYGLNMSKKTYQEIAQDMNITETNVKQIRTIALKNLKELYSDKMLINKAISEDMNKSLMEVVISTRANNALICAGYETLGDIISMNLDEICSIRNIGKKVVEDIVNFFYFRYGVILKEGGIFKYADIINENTKQIKIKKCY